MHPLLEKLLRKRKIEKIEELSDDEKGFFDKYSAILSKDGATIEDIGLFCRLQLKNIEEKWKDLDNPSQKNERLIILHTVYSALITCLEAPKAEREGAEKYLQTLLDG